MGDDSNFRVQNDVFSDFASPLELDSVPHHQNGVGGRASNRLVTEPIRSALAASMD
jgi:hypothetical protein